ncbi:hypothetical protein TSUD_210590 [Trifolium subterraneum]|uniref:Reverse transcriptase Ty1/copia-type domain-containing protein n=1 Tax=Trifolium subterraneum TaxID=3900 RepID=A0A2Z6N2J4_TRISU|nr:hypothetical protein TSUD_210590 [Trifolium subterraneum]
MPPRVAPMVTDPSTDQSSPYFVHPSDGPSSVKVTPTLTGSNYHSWSRSMRRALHGKLKIEFIDGSIAVPTDPFDPSFRAWNRCNSLVHSWILNSVSDSIAQSLVFLENAIDVWTDLRERFAQADLVRIAELQQEIHSLKQESRTVTEFYSDLKLLWEELEIYIPIPNCSCRNRCTCEAMRSARNNHTMLYAIRFLTGLNEHFAMVKSQILLMDPLPTMNRVFSLVLQHERQGNFSPSDESKALLNAAKSRGFPSKTPARVCTYCGKDNHMIDNCFKKHGPPPHFRKSSQLNNAAIEGGIDEAIASSSTGPVMTQDQALQLITLLQNSFPSQDSDKAASNQVGSTAFTDHTSVNQGLYYLKLANKDVHIHNANGTTHTTIPDQAIWHFRLGHISSNRMNLLHSQFPYIIVDNKEPHNQNSEQTLSSVEPLSTAPEPITSCPNPVTDQNASANDTSIPNTIPPLSPTTTDTIQNVSNNDTPIPTYNKPIRSRNAPSYLSDYVCYHSDTSSLASITGTPYPLLGYHTLNNLSLSHHAYTVALTHNTEPKSYLEASKFECWQKAMNDELDALAKTGTWKIVDLPPLIKPIGSKWVYKVKYKADGSIERHKARLVAKGYNQVEGLDFFDTFSPVAKLTIVRLLLATAATQNWHLHQLDVNNAFLHGDLEEDVYMAIPDGVVSPKPNQVCKLLKSLYGLKQANRKWYEKLTSLLLQEGYTQSTADYSLFTLQSATDFTTLLVYVDDVILAGTSLLEFTRIKSILDARFKIKDLGILKYFLGLEVAQSREGITVSQRKYCLDLLKDSGLLGSKPVVTPLDPAIKLHNDAGKLYEDISAYRRLIGRLLYLTNTRPDISFAIQQLSQFLSKPTMVHYNAACRVVRYLKHNPGRGLFFPRHFDLQLLGFTDADWARCIDTRRSTTGYCFFLGSSLVSWKAKKQLTVSRSSSEAEYRALSTATCELIWLTFLMKDLNIHCSKPPVIYCDSQSAMHIASNPVFHERTKHLEIECHFVREKLQQGLLRLLPISTEDQLADCLTKPLAAPKFNSFISKLGLLDIYEPKLEGGC